MLEGYGGRDGDAVVVFRDGRELRLIPEWRGDSVRRIVTVVLLQNDAPIAGVDAGCFWADGDIDQRELGDYCAFAIDLERSVYRLYRAKKIDESEWQQRFRVFWKIVIKSRQIAAALEHGRFPVAMRQTAIP